MTLLLLLWLIDRRSWVCNIMNSTNKIMYAVERAQALPPGFFLCEPFPRGVGVVHVTLGTGGGSSRRSVLYTCNKWRVDVTAVDDTRRACRGRTQDDGRVHTVYDIWYICMIHVVFSRCCVFLRAIICFLITRTGKTHPSTTPNHFRPSVRPLC